jgi:cell fate (sporulation/competence/biofilm development) regulator YlbF (YheA/YmcA/DUF963 family)
MVEFEDLLARAEQVRDEVEQNENTAFRVGGVIADIVERYEKLVNIADKSITDATDAQSEKNTELKASIQTVSDSVVALKEEVKALRTLLEDIKKHGAYKEAIE